MKHSTQIKLGRTQCIRRLAEKIRVTSIKLRTLADQCEVNLFTRESANLSMLAEHCEGSAKSISRFADKHRDPRGSRGGK